MSTFEYVVTLHRRHDLGAFYEDMETAGHTCVEVPEREVECCERREISRNTHYMLTEEEANSLRSDNRVRAVEKIDELPELKKMATQTSYFNRGYESDSNHANHVHNTDKNWGLYRHFVDTSPANWGIESGNASAFPRTNQTISWDLEGEHVDIIINDDLIDPDHPEYAVNADGTGGSRVQSIDWTDYYSGSVDHWKSNLFDLRQSHGALCASSAAGNTHGLARKANLYCINSTDRPKYAKFEATRSGSVLTVISVETGSEPIEVGQRVISSADVYLGTTRTIASFGTGTGGVGTYNLSSAPSDDWPITSEYFTAFSANGQNYMWDYIRAFHKKKPVNTATNRRNPTVVNCSYGFTTEYAYSNLNSVEYRGTSYTSSDTTWTNDNLYSSFGIVPYPYFGETDSTASYFVYTSTSTSLQSDIEDAIEDGIIIVAAAGNTQNKMDVSGGDDYNNTFNNNSNNKYQGGGLFGDTGSIVVGALDNEIDSGNERKSDFSNTGPSIDVYAPGSGVLGTDSGDEGFGKIVSWSRTNNVVTFNIEGPYYPMSNLDYVATSSAPYDMRIKITMDSTTSLNGYHSFLEDYSSNPSSNPDGFKINNTGPDVALTTESGSFYAAQQVSNYILFSYDLSDPRDDTKYLYWANGTSFACPMTAGLVACWTGYFGRLDKEEFKALLAENAALNKMTAGATDDYDDKHALLGGPNSIERYAQFRATSGFTYPQNTHKARSTATVKGETSYVAFPRQRVLRYGA